MKQGRVLAGAFLGLSLVAAGQSADSKPEKPVRITEPITAGVQMDIPEAWRVPQFGKWDFSIVMPVAGYRKFDDPAKQKEYDDNLPPRLYRPLDQLPAKYREKLEIPAFRDVVMKLGDVQANAVVRNPDGTCRVMPERLLRDSMIRPGDQYIANPRLLLRPILKDYSRNALLSKYRNDQKAWEEWKQRHPGLLAMYVYSEWVNEANIIHRRIGKWVKTGLISQEEYQGLLQKFPEKVKSRDEYIARRIQPILERGTEIFFNDPGVLQAMDGAYCLNHLVAEHGVKSIVMETTHATAFWQLQMIFHRGTARQFNIPWGWYVASYYSGLDSKGNEMTDAECAAYQRGPKLGPDCGLSMSLRKRAFYLAWLSGARMFQREDTDRNWWPLLEKGFDRWNLAPEAQMYVEFFNFTRKYPDRGVPYAPVALLVERNRGLSRSGGPAFHRFRYLRSDNTMDAFITTMYPRASLKKLLKAGNVQTLVNTPYGDFVDALTPDFKDSANLKRTLPAYRAAVLIGNYPELPGMAAALREYVQNGGTLILNAAQLENGNFPTDLTGVKPGAEFKDGGYKLNKLELAGAKAVSTNADGAPLFTSHAFGKGKVVVAAARHLVPDFDDSIAAAGSKAHTRTFSGKSQFKYVQAILRALNDELMPMKVTGDIQYGFSRTAKGWRVYFINNKGETKFADSKPVIDPSKTAVVECAAKDGKAFTAVELVSGRKLQVSGGKFTLEVKPAEFAIVDIEL